MRKKLVIGNWKMNMLPNEAIEFIEKFEGRKVDTKAELVICVPYIDLFYMLLMAKETELKVGAQNMHYETSGAYTGEVSGEMLRSINTEYVIIGHSERRKYFNETDKDVALKIKKALELGLKPIVCIGETLEEKESGKTMEVLKRELTALEGLTAKEVEDVIIAYEPIWAIGTGKTASSDNANDIIKEIRRMIKENHGTEDLSILYGGSVNENNAEDLFSKSDIDGGLIGGASLKADSFEKIANSMK